MQLIWVSGPVGQIRKINITLKHILLSVSAIIFVFILLGAGLQFIGFRWAVEYNPEIAKSFGNFHSGFELDNLNYFYRSKLQEIEAKQIQLQEKLKNLEEKNEQLAKLVTPNLKFKEQMPVSLGGAYVPLNKNRNTSLLDAMDTTLDNVNLMKDIVDKSNSFWGNFHETLVNRPISVPVLTVSLSSEFGPRIDPLNHSWSEHTGIDFQGPIGTPIYSAGNGKVISANWDKAYGLTVMIEHVEGFISKYSHLSKIVVNEGQSVQLGQEIAFIGNTGRTTGPHLHFEILKSGNHLNPIDYLIGLKQKPIR